MDASERVVAFRPRTILVALAITLFVAGFLWLFLLAWHVITWVLIAVFLAMALDPAVKFFERKGLRRGLAAAVVFLLALLVVAGLGFLVVPRLVEQVTDFANAVPDFVEDLTAGRGPLGFLQEDYDIVDRVRTAIEDRGVGGVLGVTEPAIAVAQGVVTAVVGVITIVFLTFFMLLEGPRVVTRFLELLPEDTRPRWERVGNDIYRTVGGYVSGNLLISLIAGIASMIVLFALGSDYAVALAVVVALFDLVPLAGATIAAVLRLYGRIHRAGLGQGHHRRRLLPRLPAARESRSPAGHLRPHRPALAARRPDRGPHRGGACRRPGSAGGDSDRRDDPGDRTGAPPLPTRDARGAAGEPRGQCAAGALAPRKMEP